MSLRTRTPLRCQGSTSVEPTMATFKLLFMSNAITSPSQNMRTAKEVPPLRPPVYVKERLNEARHRLSLVQARKKDTCIDWQWKNIEDTITRSVQMKLFQKQTTQYHSWMPAWTHLGKAFIFPAVTNEVVELFDLKGLSVPRFGAGLLHSGEIPALTGYMTKMVFKKECFLISDAGRKDQKAGVSCPNSSEFKMKRETEIKRK